MSWLAVVPLLARLLTPGALAQSGEGQLSALGAAGSGTLAVAVVFPSGVDEAWMVAQIAGTSTTVLFTNDGSFSQDMPGDNEWWALLDPVPGPNLLRISGQADGGRVWHMESVTVPSSWRDELYPVTLLGVLRDGEWQISRVLRGQMPPPSPETGGGVGVQGQQIGLSPTLLYLGWGFLLAVLSATAALRSAILRARADEPSGASA